MKCIKSAVLMFWCRTNCVETPSHEQSRKGQETAMQSSLRRRIRLFGVPARGAPRGRLVAAVVAVLAFASLTSAQVLYGTITGNVTDATGGALRGTTVVAKNT